MMHGKRFKNIQCPVYWGTFFLSTHGTLRKPCLFSHACTVTEESFLSSVRAFESSSLRNSGNQWAYCIPLKATLANDFVRRERISTGRTGTLACPTRKLVPLAHRGESEELPLRTPEEQIHQAPRSLHGRCRSSPPDVLRAERPRGS